MIKQHGIIVITWFKERPKLQKYIIRTIASVAVVIWVLVFLMQTFFRFPMPPISGVFYELKISPISEVEKALGKTAATQSINLTPRNNGFVETLEFEEGSFIEKETIIASLRKTQERANYQSIRVEWQNALSNLKRQQELYDKKLIPKIALDDAKTLEERLRNDADSARSRLQDQLIIAPFSGLIGIRRVSLGEYIKAGQVITTLDQVDRLLVDFSFPSHIIEKLRVGLPIETVVNNASGDKKYQGKIIAINSRIDEETQSILLRAIIDNPNRLLRPGLLLNIGVLISKRNGLLIPEEALIQRLDKTYVWIAEGEEFKEEPSFVASLFSDDDGVMSTKVAKREVLVVDRSKGWVEVEGAIKEGERVLIRGLTKVSDLRSTVKKFDLWDKMAVDSALVRN